MLMWSFDDWMLRFLCPPWISSCQRTGEAGRTFADQLSKTLLSPSPSICSWYCETTLEILIEIVLTINTLSLLFHFIFLLSSLSSFSPLYFLGFFSDNKLRVIFRISKISIEAPYQLAYQRNNHQPGKSRNLENNWNTVKSSSTMVPQIIHLSHFKFIEPWKVKDRSK